MSKPVTIKVSCVGYGFNFNQYHREFLLDANVPEHWQDDENFLDELKDRMIREAKKRTACDTVKILSWVRL